MVGDELNFRNVRLLFFWVFIYFMGRIKCGFEVWEVFRVGDKDVR